MDKKRQELSRQHIDPARLPAPVRAKWPDQALVEGFVPFPKRLIRCLHQIFKSDTAAADIAVVLAMVDFLRPNRRQSPSLAYLAFIAGLSEEEFRERLNGLIDRGLLTLDADSDEDDLEYDLAGLVDYILKLTKDDEPRHGGKAPRETPF